jgi:hypothetical protein
MKRILCSRLVPLEPAGADHLSAWPESLHRGVALRHAALHRPGGLLGDHPRRPTSALLVRDGDAGALEVFGFGDPGFVFESLGELAPGRVVTLSAPACWEADMTGAEVGEVESWRLSSKTRVGTDHTQARRLVAADRPAFEAMAPGWALRGWGDFGALLARGAAFGVFGSGGLASVAWTFESDREFDRIGVATAPRLRRLGLGMVVAGALVAHVVEERGRAPLWTVAAENEASRCLARGLGFERVAVEPVFRWRVGAA